MAIDPPKVLLERFGLRPKRSFGQNFLADSHLAGKIAELAAVDAGTEVVEIGAGLGALTAQLIERVQRVVAVERDRDLVPALREIFSNEIAGGRLAIAEADAKALDLMACFSPDAQSRVISGNLPYQITGPLLERVAHLGGQIRRGVFLVQREVGDRMAALPGTPEYGGLSVFLQAQFEVERAFVIRRGAFYPQPRVDSAVVVLDPRERPFEETGTFRRVVKLAFGARRKTLRNAWKSLGTPEQLAAAAEASGVDLDARGETLGVEAFARIAIALPRGEAEESKGKADR